MSGGNPGTLCGSKVGSEYIDGGTLIRARSGAPGPLGMAMSLVIGAVPQDSGVAEDAQQRKLLHQSLFEADIDIVAKSAFGKTKEGESIVNLLRSLNKKFNIEYGNTIEGSRGDWDGTTIRIAAEYEFNAFRTAVELVHEATHALWRMKHPRKAGGSESLADTVSDELHAQENQLLMYKNLKQSKGFEDKLLEIRLENQANGTLRKKIEAMFE